MSQKFAVTPRAADAIVVGKANSPQGEFAVRAPCWGICSGAGGAGAARALGGSIGSRRTIGASLPLQLAAGVRSTGTVPLHSRAALQARLP
jgi:hypothetical protein